MTAAGRYGGSVAVLPILAVPGSLYALFILLVVITQPQLELTEQSPEARASWVADRRSGIFVASSAQAVPEFRLIQWDFTRVCRI